MFCSNGDFGGQVWDIDEGVQGLLDCPKYHGAIILHDAVQAPVLPCV